MAVKSRSESEPSGCIKLKTEENKPGIAKLLRVCRAFFRYGPEFRRMEDQGRHQRTSGAELRNKWKGCYSGSSEQDKNFSRVADPEWFISDPDPDPTFQDVSAPDPF